MEEVNAQQAANRTGRNVRTILRHIDDGSLPARKEHNGWRIRLEDLQARYGTWRKEAPVALPAARVPVVTRKRGGFLTHAEAARWLGEHGIGWLTPKTWEGWRNVALTQEAILAFALSLQATNNHRRRWRLRRCGRAGCVCASML